MTDLKWDRDFGLEQVADDEELLQELIEIFKASAMSDLANLKKDISQGAPEKGRATTHSLKGAAASLGFDAIRDVTGAMEVDCRDGSLIVATRRMPELEHLIALLQDL